MEAIRKIEVGTIVKMQSTNLAFDGNGKTGKVTHVILPGLKVDVDGEIFSPSLKSCTPVEEYVIKDGFTPYDLFSKESCRDEHFKSDFDIILKCADGMFLPVKHLPSHFYSCDTMREKFIGFDFVEKKVVTKTYKRGDRFLDEHGIEYILALVSSGAANDCVLVSLDNGNRNRIPVEVMSWKRITQDELDLMGSNMVLKVKDE